MPRHTRVVLQAVPLHVIQRGHDRQRCFFVDEDYALYRSVAQRYAQYFNYRHGTSGSPWDGRYKSCLVQTEQYLLTANGILS